MTVCYLHHFLSFYRDLRCNVYFSIDSVDQKFRQMQENYTNPDENINSGSDNFESSQCNDDGECDCGRCSTCSSVIGASSPRLPILGKSTMKNSMDGSEKENTKEAETEFQEPIKIEINHNTDKNDNVVYNGEKHVNTYRDSENCSDNKVVDNLASPYSAGDIDLNNLQDSNDNDNDTSKHCSGSHNVVVCNHTSRQFSRQSTRNSCRSRSSCHSHRGLFLAAQRSVDEPDSEVGLFLL